MIRAGAPDTLETFRYEGQLASLRPVYTHRLEDMTRLSVIENDPKRIQWFESEPEHYTPLSDAELVKFATATDEHHLFAAAGTNMHSELAPEEIGELQGWVQVNPDDPRRIKQLRELGIIESDQPDTQVLEITYAKLSGAAGRQMASGLRQACLRLSEADASKTSPEVVEPRITIVAYLIPGNLSSEHVALAAGFEERARIRYDEAADWDDRVFILSWPKLQAIIQEAAITQLMDKQEPGKTYIPLLKDLVN